MDTIDFPRIVVPAVPIVEAIKLIITLLLIFIPKFVVIEAIIVIWVGINTAASEKGIGINPSPKATADAAATTARERFF